MENLVSWALALMMTWSPPGRSSYPDAIESPEDGEARYAEIAKAAVSVAMDPEVVPAFKGKQGREKTLALLLSIAFYESRFRRDVDLGLGKHARGDHGQSYCLMQVRVGRGAIALDGVRATGKDLVASRELCFRAGLKRARQSLNICRKLPILDRLSAYTTGRCQLDEPAGRRRMKRAIGAAKAAVEASSTQAALAQVP